MTKPWLPWSAAGIVLLAGAISFTWQWRLRTQQASRLAEVTAENEQLRGKLQAAERLSATPPPAPEASQAGERGAAPKRADSAASQEAAAAEQTIQGLQGNLAQANSTITGLQSQIQDLQAQVERATADNQRLMASANDVNAGLAGANRRVDALEQQLKTKSDRVAELEMTNQKLRDQSDADARKTAQFARLSAELQEIYRRRENYLNSILRRYKDVTEQYRSLSAGLDDRRPGSPAPNAADVSRIQNSISMAEDDLRQLRALDAQAARLEKKLSGK